MTSIENEIVPKLRRAIGDTEDPYSYSDDILIEYIEDAIEKLLLRWGHEYEVDRDNHEVEPTVLKHHQLLFVMQAKLDMLDRQPDVSFSTGSLSVTRKDDSKRRLNEKLDDIIEEIVATESVIEGINEYDSFTRRLENWLYVKTLR
ncbi:MAG: hypothetical protein ACOC1X_00235 [Promethearchaeota archaeon]